MALIPIEQVGQYGIVKDQNPWQLPPNVWTDGNNVKTDEGSMRKALGYASVMTTVPVAPYYITHLVAGIVEFWVIGGLTAIHVYDNTLKATELDGAMTSSSSTSAIDVDSTADFQSKGTITIESEQITYTSKTATAFGGTITRGANGTTAATHADDLAVNRTKKWYDITRSSGAYEATAAENWTSTAIGGVLILTNGVDDPQYWALVSGVPESTQLMQDLNNWPGSVECKSMRAFRSFLVALNVTKSDVNYPRLVKWSTEAAIQTTPTSWDETSATVDAGEYELADSRGDILDGMPLRDNFMIYKEDSTYIMSYVGTPFIFSFRQLSPTVGAIAKNCVVEYPAGHAIFGNGDFYINDGRTLKPILPPKLKSYVFTTIDGEAISKSFVVADYGRSEILFCFSKDGGVTVQVDKAIVWNYNTNTFTIRDLPGVGHIGYGNILDPNVMTSWDAAPATTDTWATVSGAWTMSYPTVENVLMFASAEDTKIYRDNSGNAEDTSNMTSYIERTGLSMGSQGQPDHTTVKRITAIYPKFNIDSTNTINCYLGTQMSTEDSVTWSAAVAFNPDTQSKISVRGSGKYYGVKFESTTDMDWKLDGYSIEVNDAGRRGERSY